MLQIIPSEKRYFSDMGNMNSHFLFSFADYYDVNNTHFWNLRVFNDDFLEWNSGFGMHPHKYYEIMTIMLEGTITHKDTLGNDIKVSKNQIQVTDTATGIMHSEINAESESLKLYQVWFSPDEMSPKPKYFTATFEEKDFENKLAVLGTGLQDHERGLTSKLSVERWVFDAGKVLEIDYEKHVFLYITSGSVKLHNWEVLQPKDQLRAFGEEKIMLEFLEKTDFILIESE